MSARTPQYYPATQHKEITDQISRFDEWLRELYPASATLGAETPAKHTIDASLLDELHTTLEELRSAEGELQAQNEYLRQAQQLVEEERLAYKRLFDESPDGYIVTDMQGVIRAVNQAAALMLNRPPQLLIGKPLIVHITLERRPAFRRLLARITGESKSARADLRLTPRKGAPVDVAVHAASESIDARDRSIRWCLRDITASKEAASARRLAIREQLARRAAQASIRRLRFLAECTRATVQETGVQHLANSFVAAAARFFCDTCAIYLRENGSIIAAARRSRTPEADARSDALQILLGLEPADHGPIRKVLDTGDLMVFPPINLSLKSRRELFAAVRKTERRHTILAPIHGRSGVSGVICFHCSVDERGFGVQELGTAMEVSTRLGLAIDNARLFAAAQAGNNAKTEFLATISHELRTPLTAVIGYSELLIGGLSEPLPPVAHNWLQRIRASAEHQVRLIEDILTYVRAEAEREGVRLGRTRAGDVVDQAVSVVRPSFEQASVELKMVPVDNVVLTTDGDRVRQILINLLMNARKFTPAGSVVIAVARTDSHVRFSVSDTGVGIAPDHLEKVFEAFWQVDQSDTRRYGGSGLGLAVSRRLARQLGGELRVESELGKGSTFVLELPIEPPVAKEPEIID